MAPATTAPSDARRLAWLKWLPLALFSLLWVDLIRQLGYTWETREQYSYGWFVPFFALYLFGRRWPDRPATEPSGCPLWLTCLVGLVVVTLLPLRVIFEINADWPLVSWLYTSMVVGLTLYALFLSGGWRWIRHFVFPTAFILVAVAWPYRIEKGLTQNLMQVVANITVEVLGVINIPALQRGNLIEVSTGVVGVDEACSGIRSFQSTLMASLLMGELYRLRLLPRAAMLVCGLLLAFAFNIVRTLFLCWEASQHGISAIDKWHDSAGLTITVACFFALWVLAAIMQRRWSSVSPPQAQLANPPAAPAPLTAGSKTSVRARNYVTWLGCWTLAVLVCTEAWYRTHDARSVGGFQWTLDFPTNSTAYVPIELSQRVVTLLGHDEGGAASWVDEGETKWSAYFFRWQPRSIQAVMMSRAHRPEVCLPASGLRQIGSSSLDSFDVGPFRIPFQKYTFESEGQTLYVFFCQWEDGTEQQDGMRASKQGDRLQSVLSGRRRVGQQTLELILADVPSLAEAESALRQRLPALIRHSPFSPR